MDPDRIDDEELAPEIEEESPLDPVEPEGDDPWEFLQGLEPDDVKARFEALDNISEMQRSATQKYEEAARLRREAEEFQQRQQWGSQTPSPHAEPTPSFDDDYDGSKRYAALERRMAQMQERLEDQHRALEFQHHSTRAEQEIRRALRDPKFQSAVEHYGEEELIKQFQNRMFTEGNVLPTQVYDKASEWADSSTKVARAREQQIIQRYLAGKKKSSSETIPSSTGPKRPNRAKPASSRKAQKPEDAWKKGTLSEDEELALMQAILEESQE